MTNLSLPHRQGAENTHKTMLKSISVCAGMAFALCLLFAQPARAQQDDNVISANPGNNDTIISLTIENDSLGNGRDGNYTSGVRFSYLNLEAELPEIAYTIADYIPTFELNNSSSVYYSLGHNIFTPNDITDPNPPVTDRPYAGYAYGSLGLVTVTDDHIDDVEATLGIVGPAAMGEPIQKFVHKYVFPNAPTPEGWDFQLDNEPALMIGWQRRYPEYFESDFFDLNFRVEPNFGVTLGNVYTYASTGINFRLGPETEKWQDAPPRVRPAIPGTGYFQMPEDKRFSWYLFAGLDGRLMGRNIFLDGNTFSNSRSVDKNYLVGDANIGLATTIDQFRVSYTLNYRTKEYDGQRDSNAIFGAVNVSYRF